MQRKEVAGTGAYSDEKYVFIKMPGSIDSARKVPKEARKNNVSQ
ncbi:hypothetical protein [Candidatus Nitrososphaera evergladensis]|nr:hypothetical protein [Candidatus Nitrososphaera evergladensis]